MQNVLPTGRLPFSTYADDLERPRDGTTEAAFPEGVASSPSPKGLEFNLNLSDVVAPPGVSQHASHLAPTPTADSTLESSPRTCVETSASPPYAQEPVPLREHPPLAKAAVRIYDVDEYIARWLTPPRISTKLKTVAGASPFPFLEKTQSAFTILRRDGVVSLSPLAKSISPVPQGTDDKAEAAIVETFLLTSPSESTNHGSKRSLIAPAPPPVVGGTCNGIDLKTMDWATCREQLATYLIKKEERDALRKQAEITNTKSQISHQVWVESLALVAKPRVDRDYNKSDSDAFKVVRDHAGDALRLRRCAICKDNNDPALCAVNAINAYAAILRNPNEGRAAKDKALADATYVLTQAGSRETGLWVGIITSIISSLLEPGAGPVKSSFVQRCGRSIKAGRRFSKVRELGGPIFEKMNELLSKAAEEKREIPDIVTKSLVDALKPEIDEDSAQWDPCLKLLKGEPAAETTVRGTFVSYVAPTPFSCAKRSPSTIASQNLNGLRARGVDSTLRLMAELGWPVVMLFSEVKASWKDVASCPTFLEKLVEKGYGNIYLNFSGPGSPNGKGHAGVMALSKYKPINVFFGLKGENINDEGRVLTLEFEDFFLVAPYKPANVFSPEGMRDRVKFEEQYLAHVSDVTIATGGKPHISFGDMNVAPLPEDSHPMAMTQVKHKIKDLTYEPGMTTLPT